MASTSSDPRLGRRAPPILDLRDATAMGVAQALGSAHRRLPVGARVTVPFPRAISGAVRDDLVEGAGFVWARRTGGVIERARTLPDRVAADLRVLLCGLNPSLYAADVGVGFARPGNRFWPAALAAGLVTADRDPEHALDVHRVGMTDLVKRATARADELAPADYIHGAGRVARLCALAEPRVLCVVGLTGWRLAVDRRARVGVQPEPLGSTVVYVMPNPSGLNAHATVASLADCFREVIALADA